MNSFFSYEYEKISYPIEFSINEASSKNSDKSVSGQVDFVKTFDQFVDNFNKLTFNYFIDFDFDNVIISGGSIFSCLINEHYEDTDIDLFLYGMDDWQTNDKIKKIIEHFNKKNPINKTVKTINTITIYFDYPIKPIQIVLFKNDNIFECIKDFDLDICKVIYDGKNVICDKNTYLSISNKKILLNNMIIKKVKKTNKRILKYFKRGIKICLDGYNYNELIIWNNDIFDLMIFYEYHETINTFKKICNIYSYDNNNDDDSYYNEIISFSKYTKLQDIKEDVISNVLLIYKDKFEMKYIDIIKKNNIVKNDIQPISNIINNKYDVNCYNDIIKQSIINSSLKIIIESQYFIYAFINNEILLTALYSYNNIDTEYLYKLLFKLYVYHKKNNVIFETINNIIKNKKTNNIINKLYEQFDMNQVIFAKYNDDNNICEKIKIYESINNMLNFSTGVKIILLDINFIKSIINNFDNDEQIIVVLNNLIHMQVVVNVKFLHDKLCDYFYKNNVDENILELFLKYYDCVLKNEYENKKKKYNSCFNYVINFNDVIYEKIITNNNYINFYVNKKLTIYNSHLLTDYNLHFFVKCNNDSAMTNLIPNKIENLIPYEIKKIMNKIISTDKCMICLEKIEDNNMFYFNCECKYVIHETCLKNIKKCLLCKK